MAQDLQRGLSEKSNIPQRESRTRFWLCIGVRSISVSRGFFGQSGGGKISIRHGSGLGLNCSGHGPLSIGDNIMMGPGVVILTHTHNIDRIDIPM